MSDVETVARAIMIASCGACNVTDWAERYYNTAVAEAWDAATAALAAATPLIEARVRNALVEIAELTHRRQLPITAQIHEVALAALGKGERP